MQVKTCGVGGVVVDGDGGTRVAEVDHDTVPESVGGCSGDDTLGNLAVEACTQLYVSYFDVSDRGL